MEIKTVVTKKYGTNCYLLSNNRAAAVIDPGESENEILEFCRENLDKKEKFIILTHCHFDHIGAVNAVKKIWDCPVIISDQEANGLSDSRINLSGFWTNEKIEINPDITVGSGDVIELGEDSLSVIATPGHTKGSVCYLIGNTLFSGDTLFRLGVGRADLPTADKDSLLFSLKVLSKLDKEIRVLSGHGEETTIGYEIANNPYM